jgi:prepilin peptidase CpaA
LTTLDHPENPETPMFGLSPVELLIATLFVGLLALAVVTDVAELRIPNGISLALVGLYPVHVLATDAPVDWSGALAVAAGLFVLGAAAFAAGVFGGGDVKLLAAAGLWCGPAGVVDFALLTGIVGGILALIMVTQMRFALAAVFEAAGDRIFRDALLGRAIPYGVAIAVAGGLVAGGPLLRIPG